VGRDLIGEKNRGGGATVTAMDVIHALKRRGQTLYGFDGPEKIR
jgi:hypothetical protein